MDNSELKLQGDLVIQGVHTFVSFSNNSSPWLWVISLEKTPLCFGNETGTGIIWEHKSSGPQPFWHQGPVSWKTSFPRIAGQVGGGRSFGIQMHYIYCAFYLYYYYISSTSDHQALEPRGWGPLPTALCSYQGTASGETRAQLTLEVSFTAA